ncbi:hypothetical protein Tco_0474177 [Tanacetum coccineum]
MEEYIRLEEEKAQKRRKVFNWETAKYGKIWNDEDVHDLRSLKPNSQLSLYDVSISEYTRHLWLPYQVDGYTEEIAHDFEQRLKTIFGRQVNRVHILDFKGLTPDMRQDLAQRMRMVYTGDDGQEHLHIGGDSLHTAEDMAEDGFGAYWLGSERVILDKGDLSGYWIEISSDRDFLRSALSYTYIKDPVRRLCHRNKQHRGEEEQLPQLSEDMFIRRPLITGLAVPAPIHAPPPPPPATGRTMPQRLGRLEEEIQGLRHDVRSLRGLMERSMTDQGRFSTWMISCMTQLMEASGRTYQAFDGTFRGNYP